MTNEEDNPTVSKALRPDATSFIEAMEKEILTLIQLNIFEIVDQTSDIKVLSGVWALKKKKKKYRNGWINKLKERYCARGFEQEQGVNYFEIFSPVVMWLIDRLLLVMSIILNFQTSQVNNTGTFVHAPIDCLVSKCQKDLPLMAASGILIKACIDASSNQEITFCTTSQN